MQEVIRHIESYNFKIDKIKNNDKILYYCKNDISDKNFILNLVEDDFSLDSQMILDLENINDKNIEIVNLIKVNDNIDDVMNFIEKEDNKERIFLIYDENDELEFFLKDLWNIIISLKN